MKSGFHSLLPPRVETDHRIAVQPDFSLTTTPASRTIVPGSRATYTPTVTGTSGFSRLAQRQRTACGRFGVVQPGVYLLFRFERTERFSPRPPRLQAVLADGQPGFLHHSAVHAAKN